MNGKAFILLGVLFTGLLCACNKNDTDEKWAEEEAKLAEYIGQNIPEAILDKGIYIDKLQPAYPDNIQPEPGDYVLVDYVCKFLFDEGVVEYASLKDWQGQGALYPSTFREGGPELWTSEYWGNMGVGQLRENEYANVYIPSRLLGLQDFKTRIFQIYLNQVIDTDIKTYQEKLMEKYMKQYCNNVDTITIKENGKDYYVIYHIASKGTGNTVDASNVKTHTSESYFLQDNDLRTCFSSREYDDWNNSKFSGMFKSVKKGGKIIVVMPYKLMYGEEPYKDDTQIIAPMHSVLRYEISIDL